MTSDASGYNAPEPFFNDFSNPDLAPTSLSPQILPTYDPSVAFVDQNDNQTSAAFVPVDQYLKSNPRQVGTGSVTFTGSVTAGDTCYVNVAHPLLPNGVLQFSTLALSGDTLTLIASRLLTKMSANAILRGYGVTAGLSFSSTNPVITLFWPGPLGQFAVIATWSYITKQTATIGGSVTSTDVLSLILSSANLPANSATLTVGGTPVQGDVLVVTLSNSNLANGTATASVTAGVSPTTASVAALLVTALGNAAFAPLGLAIVEEGGNIQLVWNAAVGNVKFSFTSSHPASEVLTLVANGGAQPSALAPTAPQTETVTLSGSATTNDVVSLTVYSPSFQQPLVLQYVVQGGDTLGIIAAALNALVNANPTLANGQCTSSVLGSVLTITWLPTVMGFLTFAGQAVAPVGTVPSYVVQPPSITLSVTAGGGDSTTTLATALKNLINADVILTAAGVVATSSAAIISIFSNGSLAMTFASALSGGATETITLANGEANSITITGTATTGDTINAVFTSPSLSAPETVSIIVTSAETTTQMATALAAAINADMVLEEAGITATSSSNVVNVAVGPSTDPPVITVSANGAGETLTFAGTNTTGDRINVLVTNAALAGGFKNVQYSVVSGDSTSTLLATHVAAALNADTDLHGAGFVATPAGAVVTIHWPAGIGAVTFATSVNGVETATVSGTPTNGEIPTITIIDAGLGGGQTTYSYTEVVPSDTNSTIAAAFATAMTADTALAALGITAVAVGAILSITSHSVNQTTYSRVNSTHTTITLAAGPTETGTLAGGPTEVEAVVSHVGTETLTPAQFTGCTGPVIPTKTFNYSASNSFPGADGIGSCLMLTKGVPVLLDYNSLVDLMNGAAPII